MQNGLLTGAAGQINGTTSNEHNITRVGSEPVSTHWALRVKSNSASDSNSRQTARLVWRLAIASGSPTTRESMQHLMAFAIQSLCVQGQHHLFSLAVQSSTTDMGAVSASFTGVMIRNRWPSRLTS
jgi:hypothetical protein